MVGTVHGSFHIIACAFSECSALVSFGSDDLNFHEVQIHSLQLGGGYEWRLASCRLSSLLLLYSD